MFNEEEVEKVIEKNNELIGEFVQYLLKKGLKEKTIRKHLNNITLFLNHFLPYYAENSENEVANVYDGLDELDSYFGNWYIRKVLFSDVSNLKSSITSIKKFYQFLYEKGDIENIDLDILKNEIKEMKNEWILKMQKYNSGGDLEEFYWYW